MLHLIGRSNNSMRFFRHFNDFHQFMRTLIRLTRNKEMFVHHYVLMHTHFHLLAWVDDTSALAATMKAIAVSYNHYYHRQYGFKGHIWHSRFRSIIVEDEAQWAACGRYIELNPVRAGICSDPAQHRWSSYHHYAFGKSDRLVRPTFDHPSLGEWNAKTGSLPYREFIAAGLHEDQDALKKCYSAP